MSMFDTGTVELILPNKKRFTLGMEDGLELQTYIACIGMRFHVANAGTSGYSPDEPYNPFLFFKNTSIQFSIGQRYGSAISDKDFKIYFNKYGVVYKVGFVYWDRQNCKWIDDPKGMATWPDDQIKEYNRKAIIERLKLFPSRFKAGTSRWLRLRTVFHFMVYLRIRRFFEFKKSGGQEPV